MSLWPKWYSPPVPPRLPLDRMLAFVAGHYGVTIRELKGQGRQRPLVNGRSVIAKVLRERGLSYPVIARLIGRSDHTTAMNLVETFDTRAKYNPEIMPLYHELKVREANEQRLVA